MTATHSAAGAVGWKEEKLPRFCVLAAYYAFHESFFSPSYMELLPRVIPCLQVETIDICSWAANIFPSLHTYRKGSGDPPSQAQLPQFSLSRRELPVSCMQLKMPATKVRMQLQKSNVKDTAQTHFWWPKLTESHQVSSCSGTELFHVVWAGVQ